MGEAPVGESPSTSPSTSIPVAEVTTSDEAFYAPIDPVPVVPHGTLLRSQLVEPGLAGGGASYRIMYASESVAGEPIAVTGWVDLPTPGSPVRADGIPVISWGHGTTGMADACAPSKFLDYGGAGAALRDDGFAIVATDYEGLGTPGLHPYLVGESEGRSVLDATLAARELPGVVLGDRTVLWGHSQGGHAVAFAHQLAATWAPELEVVGTVAIAPPAVLSKSLPAAAAIGANMFMLMAMAGVNAAHPEADLSAILKPEAVQALGVLDTACDLQLANELPGGRDLLIANPGMVEPWATLTAANDPGGVTAKAPVLIVHGDADNTVPPVLSRALAQRWCDGGQVVQRWLAPGLAHATVLTLAPQMRRWVLDRFDDAAAVDGCGDLDARPPRGT